VRGNKKKFVVIDLSKVLKVESVDCSTVKAQSEVRSQKATQRLSFSIGLFRETGKSPISRSEALVTP